MYEITFVDENNEYVILYGYSVRDAFERSPWVDPDKLRYVGMEYID